MFNGINFKQFLSTHQEWHALAEGFCEVMCPWPARHAISDELQEELCKEHHYYVFGRAAGVVVWIGIIALLGSIFL